MVGRCETIFWGMAICFVINVPLFPIINYSKATAINGFVTFNHEGFHLVRMLLCCLGGILLYRLKYGKLVNPKITFKVSLAAFVRSYGYQFAGVLGAWAFYVLNINYQTRFMLYIEGLFGGYFDTYLEHPVGVLFLQETLCVPDALFAYILFAMFYCWRKNKVKLDVSENLKSLKES